jgi:hypothetical protein
VLGYPQPMTTNPDEHSAAVKAYLVKSNAISEATFVVEQEVGAHTDLFIEYVGDYPNHGAPHQIINSGTAYRCTALSKSTSTQVSD